MEISFQLTPGDIAAFQKLHARRYGMRWPFFVVLFGLAIGILPQLIGSNFWLRLQMLGPATVLRQMLNSVLRLVSNLPALLSLLIPIAFFLFVWLFLVPRVTRGEIQKTDAYKMQQTIKLSAEGLFQSQASGDFLYRWPYLFAVIDDAAHIFLLINRNTAVVVPKRAFASEQEAQQFFETARDYWQQNQDAPPPIPAPIPAPPSEN